MSKHLLGFKAICVSVALLASAPSFCDNALGNRIAQLESDMNQIRGQTALGNYGAKTASATPQIDGYGLFLTADFLWWKLYEGGTEYALKNENSPFNPNSIKGPIKHLNFDWEPGYKVGLGYLFDHDGWDLYLDFTSFKTHAHSSASSDIDGLFPLMGIETNGFAKAKAHWHVDFYDLNLVLGKSYFVSKYLALRPHFGLTSAWIQQHRHARFKNLPISSLKLRGKNNFWGIGPRLGVDSQFYLGRHFSLYGDIAGALLWGHFHVKEKERDIATGSEIYDLHDHLHRMVATVGFSLGLSFETNFFDDSSHFMIKAGYEGQYWWRQNQWPIFNSFAVDFTRQSEDLNLQGLTVDFRLDF